MTWVFEQAGRTTLRTAVFLAAGLLLGGLFPIAGFGQEEDAPADTQQCSEHSGDDTGSNNEKEGEWTHERYTLGGTKTAA